jgi:SWI/SNF-related matrix-associated actin-dependent regulator of chromatin subfamily A member 5
VCRDEDYARPLSEEEQLERDRLLTENPFKDWMRRDFNAFLRACEKHGRANIDAIAKEVESKTEEEVKAYAEVFFKRYRELHDYERYIKQIERGEQKIQRQQGIMKVCYLCNPAAACLSYKCIT